jgi:hypothetical protein
MALAVPGVLTKLRSGQLLGAAILQPQAGL